MLKQIEAWHQAARPEPTERDFSVQLGCHLEELAEMLESMEPLTSERYQWFGLFAAVEAASICLKNGSMNVVVKDREALLDSLADQIVTAVGVGYCASMNVPEACERVNTSNYSKMVDGKFIRDGNGKIAKPASYAPPDLKGLY